MTIGVGIVGLSARGGWAALAHVPALRALPGAFRLTGLAGSTVDAAAAAAEQFTVPFHTADPAELAAHPSVDLLVIAVKVPEHGRLIQAVANAGKPIYCEWPLGTGLAEAQALDDLTARNGIPGFIGLQARSAPPLRLIADLIRDGFVGNVLSSEISAIVEEPWNGRSSRRRAYLNDRTNGATMLSIPFGHCLDAATIVLGAANDLRARLSTRYPVAQIGHGVTIASDVEDHIGLLCSFGGSIFGSFNYRGGTVRGDGFRWEIVGSQGTLVVIGRDGHLQYGQVRIAGCRGDGTLETMAVPASYVRVPLDPSSHAFTVAHAYLAVADALQGAVSTAPRFADAVQLHALLDGVEHAAR